MSSMSEYAGEDCGHATYMRLSSKPSSCECMTHWTTVRELQEWAPPSARRSNAINIGSFNAASCAQDGLEERPREAPAGGSGGSARQLCASALVRLVADLWLAAGPSAAFPLALLLLRRHVPPRTWLA